MGHPDKVADRIADSILDRMLKEDPRARVACEVLLAGDHVVIAGEISSDAHALTDDDITAVVRSTIREIGYDGPESGFDVDGAAVHVIVQAQSDDIALGVDADDGGEMGAGDQGMMFGYAVRETDELMPLPIMLAHRIMTRQAEVRVAGIIPDLRPDAKTQVTVAYEGDKPAGIDSVVLSTQHGPDWSPPQRQKALAAAVTDEILRPVLAEWWRDDLTIHINPTGRFEIGGPRGDTGLTGRKIIVDTYGGWGRHGGGAFSGKDPSKVDRSASYMARHIAKNLVAAGLIDSCEIQLSYAIGIPEPTSVMIEGTGGMNPTPEVLEDLVRSTFRLTPTGIIDTLRLQAPIYTPTSYHGHFGRNPDEGVPGSFPWERIDKAGALRVAAGR
jgi:S-adenosylmethionine synthetase